MRGRLHTAAAWYFGGMGTALTIVALAKFGISWMPLTTALYALCLAAMLSVSALYHRVPWRSAAAVNSWRRADHAMIAIFIAGTYGPVTVAAFGARWFTGWAWFNTGGLWILTVCWLAALAAVVLNLVWIDHPRWLDAATYLTLGWLAAIGAVGYYQQLGVAVSLLMLLGGLVYSLGAVI